MATIQIIDGTGTAVFMSVSGSGTDLDPFIPIFNFESVSGGTTFEQETFDGDEFFATDGLGTNPSPFLSICEV